MAISGAPAGTVVVQPLREAGTALHRGARTDGHVSISPRYEASRPLLKKAPER